MSKTETKYCSNCCQNIEASKFFLHERMCSQNVKKCPHCNKPFTIEDLDDHIEEAHGESECEYCKKKFPNSDIDKHRKKCDSKLVPCAYCEMLIVLGEIKEHQAICGAITEPCPQCGRFVQRKELETHIMEGCPPPKNDRRSVEVTHNNNSKLSLNNKNDNLYNNYNPINNFNPDDFLNEFDTGKVDIKINSNYNKPKLPIRPPSGKKILNDNARKLLNSKNANTNRENNINIINNELSNDKKDKERLSNKNINNINNNNSNKFGNYMNRQNDNKGAIPLKPIKDSKNIPNTSRYGNFNNNNNNKNTKRSSKPAFATNMSKTSLNSRKTTDKTSDEEFRKTREKFTFQNAKNIEKYHLNQNAIKMNNSKGFLNNDNFVGDFNFGEIDDEQQLLQQVIEQSLKDSKNK